MVKILMIQIVTTIASKFSIIPPMEIERTIISIGYGYPAVTLGPNIRMLTIIDRTVSMPDNKTPNTA
ncbi:hypothetical protein D3C86_1910810 [compost metagenome]